MNLMASSKKLIISSAINFGWETIKQRFWFFVGLTLFVGVVEALLSSLNSSVKENQQMFLWLIVMLLMWFIEWGLNLGMIVINLKTVDEQKAKFDDLFSKFDVMLMLRFFVASLVTGLAVTAGFLLLIVPGIIIALRLSYVGYALVDKNLGPIEAVKRSWEITKGNTWNLFLFMLTMIGVNLLGALLLLVGLFVTIPLSMLATAYVYRELAAK
jgi:uncharacterized membrane protein